MSSTGCFKLFLLRFLRMETSRATLRSPCAFAAPCSGSGSSLELGQTLRRLLFCFAFISFCFCFPVGMNHDKIEHHSAFNSTSAHHQYSSASRSSGQVTLFFGGAGSSLAAAATAAGLVLSTDLSPGRGALCENDAAV